MIHQLMLIALGLTLLGVVPGFGTMRLPSGMFGLLLALMVAMILLF
ncbi:hypothetical protein LOC68_12985 [Blastopirellula sp. JC732]|uniref:Uncharacterized protein n=1 Tax=Blastopirellula sediminis TaxID=2894196 RepID=A0A9X1MN31_9BACT|nr:hypothetical protein [Blastopirellula sediminis]MCC9607395.1 hypothetical protein [Blastopirellula sediminis]MCC9629312.1 hypothetical protein [Blastopirellula sediminis]